MTRVRMPGTRFTDSEHRLEGQLKVTGGAHYTDDLAPPGTLHAGFLTSPYPAARILSVDVTAARQLPGVHAVLTGADTAGARFGRYLLDWPVLASDVVRFVGDRVVAVAAETPELVTEALALVEVEYEELPAVFDPVLATAADAPVLHPDSGSYRTMHGDRKPVPHPNVQGRVLVSTGDEDVEQALAAADLVVESHYTTPRQHHGFLEPHAALVWIEADGTVQVVSTNKAPFALKQQMARALELPAERIVVRNAFIGGDFGGKGLSIFEFALYFLAQAAGRPVKAVMSYADELSCANTRHAASIRLRTGLRADGTFLAHAAEIVLDGGAYAAGKVSPELVLRGASETMSCYAVPTARIEVSTVYTNTVPGGHMRSPGEVQTVFAGECHIDAIAERLGIDPLELRRRNVVRAGDSNAGGERFSCPAAAAVLEAAGTAIEWSRPRPAGRGVGVSLYQRASGVGRGGVELRALPGGSFELITGSVDQGGGLQTALRRVAAVTLDVAEDRVRVVQGSTRDTLFDNGTGSSRSTRVLGEATRRAAIGLLEQLASTPLTDTAVSVSAEYEAVHEHDDNSFIAIAVEVEVDIRTGQVRVLDAVLAVDVGEVINPVAHRGQLEGGFVFGLGAALYEELPVEAGQVVVGSLGDYKLPTIADIPPLRIVQLRGDSESGPYGAKAVGELSNCGVPPAIAGAVFAACGVRLTSLPMTAASVYAAIQARPGQSVPA